MSAIKKALQETKTRVYQSLVSNKHHIELNQAIVSVTFDDVPKSALNNGLKILDRHSVKATFYVAAGLSETKAESESDITYLSPNDIKQLHQTGHDIACHTYSHYRLGQGNAEEMADDAEKNIKILSSWLGGKPIEHFSYPFGEVSFKAKKLLSKYYKTMRSSRPGINAGGTDLYLLRATSLYHPNFDKTKIQQIVTDTIERGGWLILYTHGVDDNPGPFDCTPEQLDWVLNQVGTSNVCIQPIAEAYQTIKKLSCR
jgi:peptidoglycan/xylan/chitin deacetylase (PgdA/CDA1 family)